MVHGHNPFVSLYDSLTLFCMVLHGFGQESQLSTELKKNELGLDSWDKLSLVLP